MRRGIALTAVLLALVGCVQTAGTDAQYPKLRYSQVLSSQAAPVDVTDKLVPPTGACWLRARARLDDGDRLLQAPLYEPLRSDMERLLDGLHPVAKRVLARTHGIWLASHIPDAAAVYLPCDVDEGGGSGGFILLDASEYPIDSELRDAHVPVLYWRALAGLDPQSFSEALPVSVSPGTSQLSPDPALRYLVVHELGHALSLFAGEFDLSETARFRVGHTRGFVRFSWRLTTPGGAAARLAGDSDGLGVAPRASLSLREWASVRQALEADPALPQAGQLLSLLSSRSDRARRVCAAARKLPRAGFVTPTAAIYPTEDYAEMFAHAILATEGKIGPQDRVHLRLPRCGVRTIRGPYFSPWMTDKRAYLESALGLDRGIW